MPGGNGTGPLGMGPLTGRGLGPCGAGTVRNAGFGGFGAGFGGGRGRARGWGGRGFRNRFNATGVPGWQWGWQAGQQFDDPDMLQQQINALQQRLDAVQASQREEKGEDEAK